MSDLKHVSVPLRDGLDLFSPRLEAPPGSLVGCKNYEVLDTVGYRRIDGFERFDGTASPSVNGAYYELIWVGDGTETYPNGQAGAFLAGDRLYAQGSGFFCGYILSSSYLSTNAWRIVFSATVSEGDPAFPEVGDGELISQNADTGITGRVLNSTLDGVMRVTRITFDSPLLANATAATEAIVADSNTSYLDIRDEKTKLPWWSARVHGLHWFKDRLYAVADCEYVYLVSTGQVVDGALFPGEIFTFGTAQFELMDFQLLEGSLYESGAVVKCLVRRIGSVLLSAEHLTQGGSTRATGNTLTLYSTAVPTLTSGITDPAPWGAALYRTTSQDQATAESQRTGWNPVEMGLEVDFVGGTGTPIVELSREFYEEPVVESTASSLDASGATTSFTTGTANGFAVTGASVGAALETAADGSYISLTVAAGGPPNAWTSGEDSTDIRGFDASDIPDDCFITGIEVKLVAATRSSGGTNTADATHSVLVPEMYLTGFERLSQNRGILSITEQITGNTGYNTYTWGGDRDLWGIGDLINPDSVRDEVWGFKARFLARDAMTSGEQLRIEQAYITIHYIPATSRVFIGDSTNRVSVDAVRVHVRKNEDVGSNWTNAEGTLHVYNIGYNAGGTRSWIQAGDGIYLAASGGSAIATVAGTKGSMLPTLAEISEAGTRYEMITANYYAREDWESIYGANGVGRAFAWDDKYFRKIYTELDSTVDTPRHLAYYRNFLALGYKTGNILLSALTADGPEPENFSSAGDGGAQGFNFNDKVYGLLVLPDTSLGVFCEGSIHRLVLTADGNLNQSTISANTGILEYTLAPLGPTVVFCDRRGIRSLDQVDAYGDFIGRPLSTRLGSWLRNRLTRISPYSGSESLTYPVVGYSVRNKNQYRLWFRDGTQLTMTFLGAEESPIFTFQEFKDTASFDEDEPIGGWPQEYYVPIALSSGLDSTGRERIHFAHYAPWEGATAYLNVDDDKKYVFEMDQGWHFDDNDIPGYVDIAYNILDNPVQDATLTKVRLYGASKGIATLQVTTRNLFNESFSNTAVDISLPRNSDTGFPTDNRWYSNIAYVAERGQHISIRIEHPDGDPEPSHTLQSLILDYTPGKTVN